MQDAVIVLALCNARVAPNAPSVQLSRTRVTRGLLAGLPGRSHNLKASAAIVVTPALAEAVAAAGGTPRAGVVKSRNR